MKRIHYILLLLPFAWSCEKAFFEEDLKATDPQANFDYLWKECDEKYSFFELKKVDWNKVKTNYSARIHEDMTEDSLFNVLGGMLTKLRDDHTNLISNFNVSYFGVTDLGPDNFDWRLVTDHYLKEDLYSSGPFQHGFLEDKRIGYIRFPGFTGTVGPTNLDFMLERYKDTEGLILDLRENGGGAVTDVFNLLARFVEEETVVYYSRIKNGPGHNDFSEAMEAKAKPYDGIRYTKKVAVLTDRGTYSAGSFTSLATKALPNMVLIGDTTGGGLGLPNGGQLPNGWTYRFSITQALSLDKSEAYEDGVPPDIQATLNWDDRTKDEVIERALQELLN